MLPFNLLGELELLDPTAPLDPIGDAEYKILYDKFVVEDSVQHLTWDVIVWLTSVTPPCKIVRIRYEYEKIIPGAYGKDMFLEVTYDRKNTVFPHPTFCLYPVINWVVYSVDFVDLQKITKVMVRMAHKDDLIIRNN